MTNPDYLLYALHVAVWLSFGVTRAVVKRRTPAAPPASPEPASASASTARFSRTLVAVHSIAFFLIYLGMGESIIPNRVPDWFPGQRVVGALIIVAGAAMMCWALIYFKSWRFRATVDADHELATGGPFRLVRHPIYTGLDLFAVGSAVWVPTPILALGALVMIVGSDLRGRAEETVLVSAFGDRYRQYAARTKRFLPGLY